MIFTFIFLYAYCCLALRTNSCNRKLFFVKSYFPSTPERKIHRLYEYDESFNDLVDNLDTQDPFGDELEEKVNPRDQPALDLSANSVTICGRIGFISEPFVFHSGIKNLRLAVATSERDKNGTVQTHWHKVMVYGLGNVDYIHSRARVGDRALVIGQLRYYTPQNFDASGSYRPKIAEIYVNSYRGGSTFILLPKNPSSLSANYPNENQQVYPEGF